jgi:hypothetical protein
MGKESNVWRSLFMFFPPSQMIVQDFVGTMVLLNKNNFEFRSFNAVSTIKAKDPNTVSSSKSLLISSKVIRVGVSLL